MSLPSTVFIVYSPQNIEGGGHDTILRGLFPSLEQAHVNAQSLASLDSFNEWLKFPIEFKSLYDRGDHSVYQLHSLIIIEVPFSVAINGEFSGFPCRGQVIAKCNHPQILNHPLFAKYQHEYGLYVKTRKINFGHYLKVELLPSLKGE
jgi:hypothetical protein